MADVDLNNIKLKALMQQIKITRSEQNMLELLAEAAVCNYLVPVDGTDKISFHALQGAGNKVYLVVYADGETFLKDFASDKKQKTVLATFADLIEAVLNESLNMDGFILNPGHEEILFGKDMLKLIKDQMPKQEESNDSASKVSELTGDIKIGDSNKYPEGLKETLNSFGKDNSEVTKIFLRLYQKNPNSSSEEQELGWLFVIEFNNVCSGELQKKVFSDFDKLVVDYVDNMPYMITSSSAALGVEAMKNAEPVYSRFDE